MKRTLLFGLALAVLTATVSLQPVAAQEAMTETHIQRIQQSCTQAKRTIQQLHASDGPLRVNRGQAYEYISTKLMTPLNSRLIVNKLDASALVKVTAQYDKALTEFRSNYRDYDNQMSQVLLIDCKRQPVTFYDAVAKARELRTKVHASVTSLHTYVADYEKEFGIFRTEFKEGRAKGEE